MRFLSEGALDPLKKELDAISKRLERIEDGTSDALYDDKTYEARLAAQELAEAAELLSNERRRFRAHEMRKEAMALKQARTT